MSLRLKKGGSLLLKKENGLDLKNVVVQLFWAPSKIAGISHDLDVIAVETQGGDLANGRIGKVSTPDDVCYWAQKRTKSMFLPKDNRDGVDTVDGEPDEMIEIELGKVGAQTTMIPVFVEIHDAKTLGQSFDQVEAPQIKLVDKDTGRVLAESSLDELQSGSTSALFVVLHRSVGTDNWSLQVVNTGHKEDLEGIFKLVGAI